MDPINSDPSQLSWMIRAASMFGVQTTGSGKEDVKKLEPRLPQDRFIKTSEGNKDSAESLLKSGGLSSEKLEKKKKEQDGTKSNLEEILNRDPKDILNGVPPAYSRIAKEMVNNQLTDGKPSKGLLELKEVPREVHLGVQSLESKPLPPIEIIGIDDFSNKSILLESDK